MPSIPLSEEQKVRHGIKQLKLTWADIEAEIDANNGTLDVRAHVRGLTAIVRVIVRVRAPTVSKWAMAIVLGRRIDGIDWEAVVHDHRGKAHNCSGWHRHMWKPESLDTHKECLPDFNPQPDIKSFIIAGFKVLKVDIKKGEAASANRKLHLD